MNRAAPVILLISGLLACGTDADTPGADAGEADAAATERPASESGWAIRYSGALEGEVSGGVAVVTMMTTAMNSVSFAARSTSSDARLSASYQVPRDWDPVGEYRTLAFGLTLDDGTRCSIMAPREQSVTAKVIDGEKDTYHTEFEGTIGCGEDRVITIAGHFRQ